MSSSRPCAQEMLDDVEVSAILDELRCEIVPQVVEPEVIYPRLFACPPKCHGYLVWPQGLTSVMEHSWYAFLKL